MAKANELKMTNAPPARIAAACAAAALVGWTACAPAQPAEAPADMPEAPRLADLSLEELGNIEITSVSKHAERLADAPASVYVITSEDIRRSGANTLPEALRLAPNLEVAQVSASSYAISARGFNSTTANKLLVLIDGRTVYTPLYSGVFWDAQDVMLEDVDRIEVISGPGATLWGANAVNGIINVITRAAGDTPGGLVGMQGGSAERGGGVRYGGRLGGSGAYRVYAKTFDIRSTLRANGIDTGDPWDLSQVGFRTDWGIGSDGFTLQGDAYRGRLHQPPAPNGSISGSNLIGRWNSDFADGSHLQLQGYHDHTERRLPGTGSQRLNTEDLEFQHSLAAWNVNTVTWGGGYRIVDDKVTNSAMLAFLPAERLLHWSNVFVQDEVALVEGLRLTVGGKIARNPYTGSEFLPSARLAWKPDADSLLWGGVSRAVRAPSRFDRDLNIPGQPPFLLVGGSDFVSEVTNVAEIGFRDQFSRRMSYSVSAYRNWHDRLRSLEQGPGGAFVFGNKMEGTTTGLETWGSFQATAKWRLSAGGFLLKQRLHLEPGSTDPNGPRGAGNDPEHQWMLRSSLDLPNRAQVDLDLRRVAQLPDPYVPAYTALDLRYAFYPWRDVEASVVGRNLLDSSHAEFGPVATRDYLRRSVDFKLRWVF